MSSTIETPKEKGEDYAPISCSDYDFLEIMCMDRYRVVLSLDLAGCVRSLVGTALDLKVRSPDEFLMLRQDSGAVCEVRVDYIRHVRVLTEPNRFEEHRFGFRC